MDGGTGIQTLPQVAASRQSCGLVRQWLLENSQKGSLCLYQHLPLDSETGTALVSNWRRGSFHAGILIHEEPRTVSLPPTSVIHCPTSHLSTSTSNYQNSNCRRTASWDQRFPQSGRGGAGAGETLIAGVSGKEFWYIPTITSISDEMSMAESS